MVNWVVNDHEVNLTRENCPFVRGIIKLSVFRGIFITNTETRRQREGKEGGREGKKVGRKGGVEIGYLHRLIACGVSFQHVRQLRFSSIIKQNLGITRYSFLRKCRFRFPK